MYEDSRSGPWAERACYTFAHLPLEPFITKEEKRNLVKILHEHPDPISDTKYGKIRNKFVEKMIMSPNEATATAFFSRKPSNPDPKGRGWVTLFAHLSHPVSRGSVHITSNDVYVKPRIDFGYYEHPLDLEVHANHVQTLEKIVKTEPLSKLLKKDGARVPQLSDTSTSAPISMQEAKEIIKGSATTNYHPCGTCSMLPENMGGVLDNKLRVYGTKNVRVVDASMIPIVPRRNIITTVYAVAEKASDIISHELGAKRTT